MVWKAQNIGNGTIRAQIDPNTITRRQPSLSDSQPKNRLEHAAIAAEIIVALSATERGMPSVAVR